jgi:hypothetical protein
MSNSAESRLAYIDQHGRPQCVSPKAVAAMPSDFTDCFKALCNDMWLAIECLDQFGGIPLPVARAILRNMEPARAAIDLCVRMAGTAENHGVPGDGTEGMVN